MNNFEASGLTLVQRLAKFGRWVISAPLLQPIRENAFTIMGLSGLLFDVGLLFYAFSPADGLKIAGAFLAILGHTILLAQSKLSSPKAVGEQTKKLDLLDFMRRGAQLITCRLGIDKIQHSKALAYGSIGLYCLLFGAYGLLHMQGSAQHSQVATTLLVFGICSANAAADLVPNKLTSDIVSKIGPTLGLLNLIPLWGLAITTGKLALYFSAFVGAISTLANYLAKFKPDEPLQPSPQPLPAPQKQVLG